MKPKSATWFAIDHNSLKQLYPGSRNDQRTALLDDPLIFDEASIPVRPAGHPAFSPTLIGRANPISTLVGATIRGNTRWNMWISCCDSPDRPGLWWRCRGGIPVGVRTVCTRCFNAVFHTRGDSYNKIRSCDNWYNKDLCVGCRVIIGRKILFSDPSGIFSRSLGSDLAESLWLPLCLLCLLKRNTHSRLTMKVRW